MSNDVSSENALTLATTSFMKSFVRLLLWNLSAYLTVALNTVDAYCSPLLSDEATLMSVIWEWENYERFLMTSTIKIFKINSKPSSSCRLEMFVELFRRIFRSTIRERRLASSRKYFKWNFLEKTECHETRNKTESGWATEQCNWRMLSVINLWYNWSR